MFLPPLQRCKDSSVCTDKARGGQLIESSSSLLLDVNESVKFLCMPLGIHTYPTCLSLECQEVPINIAAVGREITSSSSFPRTGQYVILKRDWSQPKLTVLAATFGNKCLKKKSGKVFFKKCRGTYVMRFPPRTSQTGTVRKTVRKWNLGLPLCTYPLLCISAGAEAKERALIHGA